MNDVHIALVHYPVLDRNGRIVTSAITSLDLHDLARSARTYGARAFFVVHPIAQQRDFAARVINHWMEGPGREYDSRRQEGLRLIRLVSDLDEAIAAAENISGARPEIVMTSAREKNGVDYRSLRDRLESPGPPFLIVFGTGFGLAPDILDRADMMLAPIRGRDDYNHLSVRAAAAAILDRLLGN
ncbi:MAG: RNA methyltransferase [Candidatus Binataceae bacterium]